MRRPMYLSAALFGFVVALLLSLPALAQETETLADVLGAPVTGVSFYHDGVLREVRDVDAVNAWQLTPVDVSSWYTEGAPVSGSPLKRICLSLPPTCSNRIWFYVDDTDAATVYAFLWRGESRGRPHPDGIYALDRELLDALLVAFPPGVKAKD